MKGYLSFDIFIDPPKKFFAKYCQLTLGEHLRMLLNLGELVSNVQFPFEIWNEIFEKRK